MYQLSFFRWAGPKKASTKKYAALANNQKSGKLKTLTNVIETRSLKHQDYLKLSAKMIAIFDFNIYISSFWSPKKLKSTIRITTMLRCELNFKTWYNNSKVIMHYTCPVPYTISSISFKTKVKNVFYITFCTAITFGILFITTGTCITITWEE